MIMVMTMMIFVITGFSSAFIQGSIGVFLSFAAGEKILTRVVGLGLEAKV